MSYSKVQKKSFCKVCKDAGKDESVFTGHNIRNERNKVICPLLLSQSCFKCTALGHTPKYCPQGKNDEKIQKKREYKDRSDAAASAAAKIRDSRSASYFGVLCVDVVEEEIKPLQKKATVSDKPSYASILRTQVQIQPPKPVVMQAPVVAKPAKLSWADYVSSDDEDYEEEEEYEEDYDY